MPGITNPAEEYFKDGIWGWVTDQWKKLVATAGGALHVQFAGQEADVEVKQTNPGDLMPGICGWDGSAWSKLPMLLGYSEHWANSFSDMDATAGDDALQTVAVPDGYVYVMQGVCLRWVGTSCSLVQLQVVSGAHYIILNEDSSPTSGAWLFWNGECVIPKGGYTRAAFSGLTALDNIYLRVWGYKMKIAE